MNQKKTLKEIEEELKKSSEKLFKKPTTEDESFDDESILGSPNNLIQRDDGDES